MHSTRPATSRVLTEVLGLACSAGLLHAIFESTLLGLNEIRPSAVDLAILVVASVGAAAVLGLCIAGAALAPPLRNVLSAGRNPLAFRRTAWAMLAIGYLLVFLKIISYSFGWGAALLWSLPALPALALGYLAVFRKGQRAIVPLCASALLAATLCALQLIPADWGHEPESTETFVAWLLVPIGLSLLALLAAMKTTERDRPFEPIGRGAWLLATVLVLWGGFWAYLNSSTRLAGLWGTPAAAANPARPNFLLIVLDTVRADHMDLFGYERETMPNLKRFAIGEAQATNRMYTTGSWTLPSHASMFTGLYPSAHGAHYAFVNDEDPVPAYFLREDVPTLAEFLGSLGYQTAGIVANHAALSGLGLPRGFDHYDVTPGALFFASRLLWLYRAQLGDWSPGKALDTSAPAAMQARSKMFSAREPEYRRAREITTLARRWVQQHGSQPFFLFLNYMDAHDPYVPIPEDNERFAKRPIEGDWFGFPSERLDAGKRGEVLFTPNEIEFLKAQYDAELFSVDRELGDMLDFLRESGFFENTLIFITTDHGEAFFEHGFANHGNSLYQAEIGGFWVIKTPPSLGQIRVSPMMQFVDLFPTVAAVLNEPAPGHVQGLPWGNGRDYAISEVFCKSCGREAFEPVRWPDALRHELIAVMSKDQKLIRSTHRPDELYHLIVDPDELHPVAVADPEFLRLAEQVIAERNEDLVKDITKGPIDKALMEKLRSLGYIQ